MSAVPFDDDTRRKWARTLKKFLGDQAGIEIKHTLANRAIAAMIGLNEHSMAATIEKTEKSREHGAQVGLKVSRDAVEKLISLADAHEKVVQDSWFKKFPDGIANASHPEHGKSLEEIGKVPSWYDKLEHVAKMKPPALLEVHALLNLGIGWSETWEEAMARAQDEHWQLSAMEVAGFSKLSERLRAGLAKLEGEPKAT